MNIIFIIVIVFVSFINSQTLDSISLDWANFYSNSFFNVEARKMVIDPSENLYIIGTAQNKNNLNNDFLTLKYDSLGILQWDSYFNGIWNDSDVPLDIYVDKYKNVYVTGYSYDSLDIVLSSSLRLSTIKYNKYGVLNWSKYIIDYFGSRPLGSVGRQILCSDSGIYVSGSIVDSVQNNSNRDFLTVRYDSSGNEIWRKRFAREGDNRVEAMTVDCQNNIIVTGYLPISYIGRVLLTVKYDTYGNIIWYRVFYLDNSNEYFAKKILTDHDCNIYIAGDFNSPGNAKDIFLVKYSKSGELLWNKKYDSGNHWEEFCWDAVYHKNSIYISGSTSDSISYEDFLILKYDTDGTKIWDAKYTSQVPYSNDVATRLVYDRDENIYVTGFSSGQDKNLDIVVLKYDVNGQKIYEFRYSKSKSSWDEPSSISISEKGYIYLAGTSVLSADTSYITILRLKQLQSKKYKIIGNKLYQNYPNPFSRFTTIEFYLENSTFVKLAVYDILGRRIQTLINRVMPSGLNKVVFASESISSGIYFYSLIVNKKIETKKFLLIK